MMAVMKNEVSQDARSGCQQSIEEESDRDIQKNLWFPISTPLSMALISPGRLIGMTTSRATAARQLTPPLYL